MSLSADFTGAMPWKVQDTKQITSPHGHGFSRVFVGKGACSSSQQHIYTSKSPELLAHTCTAFSCQIFRDVDIAAGEVLTLPSAKLYLLVLNREYWNKTPM